MHADESHRLSMAVNSQLRLFTFWRSSAAYRVRIALHLKSLPFESVAKRFAAGEHRRPDFLALNPQGLIPALETSEGVLTQSLAIVEFLDELHPDPALLPRDPFARAQVRAMAQVIACDVHPINNLRVLNHLRGPLGHDEPQIQEWVRHWIAAGFESLEVLARRHSDVGRHLFGDTVTLADLCLVPQMYNARRFGCELDRYPTLLAIDAHLCSLPAFIAAVPEAQADADPAPR